MNKEKETRTIVDLPVNVIDQFPKHPYMVRDDDDMIQLVESIKENGIITPIIVRPKPKGRYEMISGHRRLQACRHPGHKTIKGEVLEMDINAATIMMVDSNLARSRILPSEKAFAYKMKLDAMKKQGKRNDLILSPMETKLRTDEKLSKDVGDSRAQIHRYIRLTELIPMLRQLVDEGTIAMRPAVEISYLPKDLQDKLADCIIKEDCTPSHDQAIRMRVLQKDGLLDEAAIEKIMKELKPNQKEHISINKSSVQNYIPKGLSKVKCEEYIVEALKHYDRFLKLQKLKEYER